MPEEAPNLRSEFRYPTDSAITLKPRQPGWDASLQGRIVDVSAHGLRLVTTRYFMRGTLVDVQFGSLRIAAEVRHCKARGIFEYTVGLKIIEVADAGASETGDTPPPDVLKK